ncbi:helix-turn-helix domain-containing protein [uncultured Marinococcus sp.]|uniref:helix-turn-helix domain-containing protein n=1 Tax=uncultured Marinococcus sp. TaxID=487012 RepID=UPI002614C843|nr:transposase [uncultured Marinococcus sp.]
MSYRGYTNEQKIAVIQAFHQRTERLEDFCDHWGIRETTLRDWISRYERYGAEALTKATQWKRYSQEQKQEAVEAYLNNGILFISTAFRVDPCFGGGLCSIMKGPYYLRNEEVPR